ncbi:S1C family serine protease [Levilactobacillus namurensis]|uniref:S1C family serine protease n=1 Tax=Levilactobacillus namurensis TaxID=380393 RepID=UPI002231E024|nr:trypsin-like peptidase domain-containing protein [Levilactobacillus namurensis]MCW3779467.1 trypsin-like peptidase domain-containing protein [Levilactobacillus namurensis]MDT7019878.1 trypsin-like peptidase domain-containing protein [Levilactobacillus namurensis]WNN65540.1 trypsin-like peptidase domain-containing protein [Levilactobacillus namurensis]
MADNNNNDFNNQQNESNQQTTQGFNDQQAPQQPSDPQPKKKRGLTLTKVAVTAAVAGLLGGGVAYGGINYLNNSGINDTAVPAGTNKTGNTKTSNVTVNVNSQSTKAFNSVKGAMVSVINLQNQSSSSGTLGELFGQSSSSSASSSKSELEEASEGSGVVYKKDGNTAYIVTNNHVVSGSSALRVVTSSGKQLQAKLVGKDAVTDLAVLKVNGTSLKTVASFGNSDKIKVGETALAIGSPLGSQYATSLTEGIISAKKRTIETTNSAGTQTGNATVIQTDAAINPGNSGGALINVGGQVIGITSSKIASDTSGTSVEGMGFAIPSNEVVNIINQLVKNGKVVRPALGITYVDLANVSSDQRKSILKLPTSVTNGVVVMSANSGSPAKKAGLSKYDVITEMGGHKISDQSTLRDILYKYKLNDTVSMTYYHNGKKKTTNVKLTESSSQLKTTTNENSAS